jgi:integrase
VVLPPKSIASNRVLALDPWTVQVLAAHRYRQLSAPGDGYVFARPGGRPYTPGYLTRRFIRLIRRAGLPPIRLHDLRHGAATLALAGGADLKAIQGMLGHASIILTADTYTSVLPDPRPHNGQSGRHTDHQGRPHTPRPHHGPTLAPHTRSMITTGA